MSNSTAAPPFLDFATPLGRPQYIVPYTILQEMIQNADDAGARTVWFYVDERQHGASNLPHPDLVRFQGPALVAANDAPFTEEDWEGIRMLQQSIKAEDPFKVGRFGIGFNSVYHVTGMFEFSLHIIMSYSRIQCVKFVQQTAMC